MLAGQAEAPSAASALPGLSSPNPENKLFVGGAPPGTDETTLQQVRARVHTCPQLSALTN